MAVEEMINETVEAVKDDVIKVESTVQDFAQAIVQEEGKMYLKGAGVLVAVAGLVWLGSKIVKKCRKKAEVIDMPVEETEEEDNNN